MTLKVIGYEPKEIKSFSIEYWYNRYTRDWVVQVFDNNDCQHESHYCPNKEWRDSVIADCIRKYNTNNINKV